MKKKHTHTHTILSTCSRTTTKKAEAAAAGISHWTTYITRTQGRARAVAETKRPWERRGAVCLEALESRNGRMAAAGAGSYYRAAPRPARWIGRMS